MVCVYGLEAYVNGDHASHAVCILHHLLDEYGIYQTDFRFALVLVEEIHFYHFSLLIQSTIVHLIKKKRCASEIVYKNRSRTNGTKLQCSCQMNLLHRVFLAIFLVLTGDFSFSETSESVEHKFQAYEIFSNFLVVFFHYSVGTILPLPKIGFANNILILHATKIRIEKCGYSIPIECLQFF